MRDGVFVVFGAFPLDVPKLAWVHWLKFQPIEGTIVRHMNEGDRQMGQGGGMFELS